MDRISDRRQHARAVAAGPDGEGCADAGRAARRCSSRSRLRVDDVDRCADELVRHGVDLLEPPTNQPFGHRTLFFRDPDGNLLEVYAEI